MAIFIATGLLTGCGKMVGESDIQSISVQSEDISSIEDSEKNDAESEDTDDIELSDSIGADGAELNDIIGADGAELKDTLEADASDGKDIVGMDDIELKDVAKIDFGYDYTDDIKSDVAYIVSTASSLQEELESIDKITQKYTALSEVAQTQGEMNIASRWFYTIWDAELNNLWSRFSDRADSETKERVLKEQRNWIAMREEVTLMSLGPQEENGSMYPLLVNSLWEEKTKNRAYFIAKELAKITGESFAMPEASAKYGLFVDDQGTGSVYSSLITREGWEGDDEAIISLYRLGELEGTFVDNGNGNLSFTSDDERIKGIIQINGWNGATFEITETMGDTVFSVGEKFEFPVVL